jgi:P27 family predicted phage terminase small subunit
MGRHPTPTKMLEFRKGKLYDEQRDRGELEPKASKDIKPRCPARFSKTERKAWKDISMVLKNYGLFTAANAIQLELLSTAWAQYLEASKRLSESPSIIVSGPDGGWMYNPWFNAQHKMGSLVDKYSQNLGLSSMQLAKIGSLMLKKKKESDSMEGLID